MFERGNLAQRLGKHDVAQADWKAAGVDALIAQVAEQEKKLGIKQKQGGKV